ncbi:MAG: helix-turn-helix domain-containing protein [Pseudonocardiaceae bacterium]|nr:helix-turn-helix domain-containing protein [Pseudonocardiaceae bacterium]
MIAAAKARDIPAVYRLLTTEHGVAQRRIAALVGQSQSEVSEILSGRQVLSYDVLARIAEGLGAPRGLLGWTVCAAALAGSASPSPPSGSGPGSTRPTAS